MQLNPLSQDCPAVSPYLRVSEKARLIEFLVRTFSACLLALGLVCSSRASETADTNHFTYVIVHGAWGGSFHWRGVDDLLTADGHKVFRAALTGQGERSHLASTNVDLSTHIADVANLLIWENLHDVVLVGHSYGGMVVTGVADRCPERIKRVVYLDAMLPENGESARSLFHGARPGFETNGWIYPTWVKPNTPPPHDVPMSAKTFYEAIALTNQAAAQKLLATYILTVDKGQLPEKDMFYPFYQRAQQRHWPAWIMEADHNPHFSQPKEVARQLERAAAVR
jgi:pimeloyl-ACP methyl ester carboxylesterase